MSKTDDIQKAIDLLSEQQELAVDERDRLLIAVNCAEKKVDYYRKALTGLRKMAIEENHE